MEVQRRIAHLDVFWCADDNEIHRQLLLRSNVWSWGLPRWPTSWWVGSTLEPWLYDRCLILMLNWFPWIFPGWWSHHRWPSRRVYFAGINLLHLGLINSSVLVKTQIGQVQRQWADRYYPECGMLGLLAWYLAGFQSLLVGLDYLDVFWLSRGLWKTPVVFQNYCILIE